jgi:hypothetical protein
MTNWNDVDKSVDLLDMDHHSLVIGLMMMKMSKDKWLDRKDRKACRQVADFFLSVDEYKSCKAYVKQLGEVPW